MARIDNRPKEKTRLTIEFADNGIILRDPDCEDIVTLALCDSGNTEAYKAVGKMIYDWLVEVVASDHADWIMTGAELNITATLTGRER